MFKFVTTDEMQALEHHVVEQYSVSLERMMQNAGKAVFDVVMNEIIQVDDGLSKPKNPEGGKSIVLLHDLRILVVCGKGNNGGDALVTARLLHEKGIDVSVLNLYPIDEMGSMAKAEMEKCKRLGIKFVENFDSNYSLIIDGIFGFSLKGNPRLHEARIIEQINSSGIKILSIDVPSGLDAHNGSISQPTIKADYTVALGLPKIGFYKHPEIVGKLLLGNVGIPDQSYRDIGYEAPMFRDKTYISVN